MYATGNVSDWDSGTLNFFPKIEYPAWIYNNVQYDTSMTQSDVRKRKQKFRDAITLTKQQRR